MSRKEQEEREYQLVLEMEKRAYQLLVHKLIRIARELEEIGECDVALLLFASRVRQYEAIVHRVRNFIDALTLDRQTGRGLPPGVPRR